MSNDTRTISYRPVESTSTIFTWQRAFVTEKFAKLTKRLAKLDAPAPTMTFGEPFEVTNANEGGFEYKDWMVEVTVTGFVANIDGWEFVAKLDHTLDENIVSSFEGCQFTLPESFRTAAPVCDHCGLDRARKYTVVLSNGSEYRQIGMACVAEYIGIDPTNAVWLTNANTLTDGDTSEPTVPVRTIIAIASEITRLSGFVRSNEPGSTRGRVGDIVFSRTSDALGKALRDAFGDKLDEYDLERGYADATEMLEWLEGESSESDYIFNMKVVCRQLDITSKHFGLVCSLPAAWTRNREKWAAEKARREAQAAAKLTSEWIGEIGQKKVTVEGVVTTARTIEGMYGSKRLIVVQTAAGEVVKAFTDSLSAWHTETGDNVVMTGTVKGHETYNDIKQTVLTRVKIIDAADVNLPDATSKVSKAHAYGDHEDAPDVAKCYHCAKAVQ